MMLDLNDLFYFVKVVEHGGFSAASRALAIPKSRLSRRIASLEKRLGVRLIQRSTRHLSVTELGQNYYVHCAAMLAEAEAAQEVIEKSISKPRGLVRLSCPTGLLCFVVADMLTTFMQQYPQVKVELDATGRRVDVVREGFDVALRVRFPPVEDSDLIVRTLSISPQKLVASPAFLTQHPVNKPSDLIGLNSLDWLRGDANYSWLMRNAEQSTVEIQHAPRLITDDLIMLRKAVVAGLGIAQLPLLVTHQDLTEGRLIEVLPEWSLKKGEVQAVFPSRRGQLPAVRALIDFLADQFADQDWQTVAFNSER